MKKQFIFLLGSLMGLPVIAQAGEREVSTSVIYERRGEIAYLQSAPTIDGKTYITWIDEWYDGYTMNIQLIGEDGELLFGETGIKVDEYPTATWYFTYSLVTDSEGNAYVSWADARNEYSERPRDNYYEFCPVIYKISPEGEFLWGEDGKVIHPETYCNPPELYMIADNLYAALTLPENGGFEMVRLDENGDFATEPEYLYGQMIESLDGDFILVNAGSKGTEAMRYNKDFEKQWRKAAVISSQYYVGYEHFPYKLQSDGKGGVIVAFEITYGDFGHIPVVQYITASGEAVFGEAVQTLDTDYYDHNYVITGVNTEEETILALWAIRGGLTSMGGQLLDFTGDRLWGADAKILEDKENLAGFGYSPLYAFPYSEDSWLMLFTDSEGTNSKQLCLESINNEGESLWQMPLNEFEQVTNPSAHFDGKNLYVYYISFYFGENYKKFYTLNTMKVTGLDENSDEPYPDGPTMVENIQENSSVEIFTIDGIRINSLQKGLNIIKNSDGTVKKIFNK